MSIKDDYTRAYRAIRTLTLIEPAFKDERMESAKSRYNPSRVYRNLLTTLKYCDTRAAGAAMLSHYWASYDTEYDYRPNRYANLK